MDKASRLRPESRSRPFQKEDSEVPDSNFIKGQNLFQKPSAQQDRFGRSDFKTTQF
jgi:hypothetical protein